RVAEAPREDVEVRGAGADVVLRVEEAPPAEADLPRRRGHELHQAAGSLSGDDARRVVRLGVDHGAEEGGVDPVLDRGRGDVSVEPFLAHIHDLHGAEAAHGTYQLGTRGWSAALLNVELLDL